MKQKLSFLSSFILILFVVSSCIFVGPSIKGNGNVTEENRKTGEFNEIEVSRGMNVYITQGEVTKVVVKADENLMDVIETRTEGDKLIVRATQNIRQAKSKKVYVTTPHISDIEASSGSNVFSESKLVSKEIELSCSSGANMTLELNAEYTEASASSGSNIKLEGLSKSFSGKASSGANIKAEKLTSEICTAQVNSGANIWIEVKKEITGKASSGGNVFYKGDPENTNIEKSSGGNVIKN